MIKITTKWLQYDNSPEKLGDERAYEAKLKSVKAAMRIRYFVFLVIAVLLVLMVNRTAGDATFVQQITFGSMLVSMILAILAIAVSARKEIKSEELRRSLEEKSALLNQSSERIIRAVEEAENYTRLLRAEYEEMESQRRELEEERVRLEEERKALADTQNEKAKDCEESQETLKPSVVERNIA